jgi:site-specific DNA recombinase
MLRRAATYARFSTDLQRDASITDQQALCRRYAERNGLEIVRGYSDSAKSGASLYGRDGLQDLMADTKAGLFEVVLVESLDRLSRDQEDLAGLFKRLSFLGVEILTANDGKADHVSIGVRGLLGALYLKDLADKTRRGLAGKVEAGQSAGGKAYGYRPLPGRPGQLEIVEEEAEIVRRIYREYAAGQTPRSIACDLNRDRIPAPRGAVWNASTINGSRTKGTGILRVDLYRGLIVWNKMRYIRDPSTGKRVSRPNPKSEWQTSDAPHHRILDSKLWEGVQARLGENARAVQPRGRRPSKRLLSGLLRCAACGGPMTIYGAPKGHPRVQCVRSRESGICDHKRTYSSATLEQGVVMILRKLMTEPGTLKEFVDTYVAERRQLVADITKRRNRVEGEMAKAKAARSRMEDNLIWGNISREKFEEIKPDLDRRIALAEVDLARTAEPPKLDLHPEAVRAYKEVLDTLHAALASQATAKDEELMKSIATCSRRSSCIPRCQTRRCMLSCLETLLRLPATRLLCPTRGIGDGLYRTHG